MLISIQIQTCFSQFWRHMLASMDGDTHIEHTSTKLRIAAPKALLHFGRPMSAHEFESWISANDPDLWSEVSSKCYDYVRMILSLTSPHQLVKYKCRVSPPGNDRRAAFYGLPGAHYGSNWTAIASTKKKSRGTRRRFAKHKNKGSHQTNKRNDESSDQIAPKTEKSDDENDMFFLADEYISCDNTAESTAYVSDEIALECWRKLSHHYDFGNSIWSQLLRALSTIKERSAEKIPPDELARDVAAKYAELRKSEVLPQILMILQREVIINREIEANTL